MSADTLYLVDGSGYIFRAYYAVAPLSNDSGMPTNALLGFTRMLMKLLKDVSAKYIAVTFDMAGPTFRHEMYDAYKANRGECPEDLVPQMPYFRSIVQAMGITSCEKQGVEADDIIATLCRCFPEHPITIVSGDKDLTQLVNDRVTVWDAMRDRTFQPESVQTKFGVAPEQIIDFLALTGDSSDNVPGLKGVGPKTAAKLLNEGGTLEELLKNPSKVLEIQGLRGREKLRSQLESSADVVRLSKELVTLDSVVEPFSAIRDIDQFAWSQANMEQLTPLFEELSFHRLLAEFSPKSGGQKLEEKSYSIVEDLSSFSELLSSQSAFAFDTETSGLDIRSSELLGISISWAPHQAFYIPIIAAEGKTFALQEVVEEIGPIFADGEIKKYGLNLKYDIGVLAEHGFQVEGLTFDSMLASYVLNPDKRQHGLKSLARIHFQEEMKSYKEVVGDAPHLGHVPLEQVADYACHDADVSWRLPTVLSALLEKSGAPDTPSPRYVFEHIEMPLVQVLSDVERRGIRLDGGFLGELSDDTARDIEGLERRIHDHAGSEFNVNSPKQLAEVLFEKLEIPTQGVKKTKSGFSTDASVLRKLSSHHPIVDEIIEYRELYKLKHTYLDTLPKLIHPKTGRIHTSFNQAVAATGRLSSSEPNLQNIPIRTERGRRIREAFVAEEGSMLISADYSQIELRVLAHLSEDYVLCEAFRADEDIHLTTARELFGMAEGAEQKRLRRIAKTINFGLIYGMSAFRLSGELGVSRKQASEYIERYFERYASVKRYFDQVAEKAELTGYTETLFGRRRFAKDIETAGRDAGYAKRSLMNAPIQGTAAEIIKLAMIALHRRLKDYRNAVGMVLQVHDELVVEAPAGLVDEVRGVVIEAMESAAELSVPLKVDSRVGKCWGEV